MQLLTLIPSFLIFLYAYYRLIKDDYVFIRKGISLEQSFDMAFLSLWSSIFFARLAYFLNDFIELKHIFYHFFSLHIGGFSLIGGIFGCFFSLYLLSRSRRIPLGRISDFTSVALLYSLPLGFFLNAFLFRKSAQLIFFFDAGVYFVLLVLFMQFLYPKLLSRKIKEGTVALLFLLCFSFLALGGIVITSLHSLGHLITVSSGVALGFFLMSSMLLLKRK
jgi:hypothetical protein